MANRPKVVVAFSRALSGEMLTKQNVDRLDALFDWKFQDFDPGEPRQPGSSGGRPTASVDPKAYAALNAAVGDAEALVLGHGAPRADATTISHAPKLRFVGELIGDRFAPRVDVEAMHAKGIKVVDATNGISPQVAEWALCLIMISLRNAGAHFRRMINDEVYDSRNPRERILKDGIDDVSRWSFLHGELTGKKVGLIGCGHIGRRLIKLLAPFRCEVRVYDPYIPKDIPDELGFILTSLDNVLSESDAVVVLAPLTPATRGMLGEREFNLMRPGSVFVNVARGAIMNNDALLKRLQRGDLVAGIDVFDPEPIPAGSPFRQMKNVFLTPHIAGTTVESWPRVFSIMIDEMQRFFDGHETLYDLTRRDITSRRGEPLTSR